jgi:hypothetical protein
LFGNVGIYLPKLTLSLLFYPEDRGSRFFKIFVPFYAVLFLLYPEDGCSRFI